MPDREWFKRINWLLPLVWASAAVLIMVGVNLREKTLEDPNAIALLDYGISKSDIQIVQVGPEQPLTISRFNSRPSLQELSQSASARLAFDEEQWARVGRLVRQFVAMANWGLGDPFLYERKDDGKVYVRAFHAADFSYRNPFEGTGDDPPQSSIASSMSVDESRPGWRVISRGRVLFLRQGDVEGPPVKIDGTSSGICLVASSFWLKAQDGSELQLSIGKSAVVEDSTNRLQIMSISPNGRLLYQQRASDGDSFIWNGDSFLVHSTEGLRGAPANGALRGSDGGGQRPTYLVFTKYINGKPTRIHVLDEATTNLIGARLGGHTPYLDGAIKHQSVERVALTLDPELQAGSFFLLRNLLLKLDGNHPLGRSRRGAVTIIDLGTGGILTHAGYPSFEADWAENRRVLVNRDAIWRNPASETHMIGSTVKVLTVAMGYLLNGYARSELLPRSDNNLAVRQAFQDFYGAELSAPLEGDRALVTPEARAQFTELGGPDRVQPMALGVLRNIFLISPDKNEGGQRERVVSEDLMRFFDQRKLESEFYPEPSYFPVLNADSMDRFRHYALGTEDTRTTTLRLAGVLGTASSGKVIRPFFVESVLDKSGSLIKPTSGAFSEIDLPLADIHFRREKMLEITTALHKVLLPGGTGFFYTDADRAQYLGEDHPETPDINEAQNRRGDYGKSGTADYGDPQVFQDSLFVYRHGRYVIAVWLEQADRGEQSHAGHRPFERHPAHKLTDQIVGLIESLEKISDEH